MFNYNDKVAPIGKSVGCDLEDSNVWQRANEKGQKFLYFIGNDGSCDDGEFLCNCDPDQGSGDYFSLEDLIPYVEDNENYEIEPISLETSVKSFLSLLNAGFIKEDDIIIVRKA